MAFAARMHGPVQERRGAVSEDDTLQTASIRCIVIYVLRHDQCLPALVAGVGCQWCSGWRIYYSIDTVALSSGGGLSRLDY